MYYIIVIESQNVDNNHTAGGVDKGVFTDNGVSRVVCKGINMNYISSGVNEYFCNSIACRFHCYIMQYGSTVY